MRKMYVCFVVVVALGLLLAACGGGSSDPKVQAGKDLFNQSTIGANAGCVTCHSLDKGVVIVGPSFAGIGTSAATMVPGLSAEAYIRQSIEEPDTFITPGFEDKKGVMPQDWKTVLTPEQEDDLVAYLLSLK